MKVVCIYLIIFFYFSFSAQASLQENINQLDASLFSQSAFVPDDEFKMSGIKNPILSFSLSFIIPGGGQFYNEEVGKGFAFFFGIGLSTALLFYFASESINSEFEYVEPMIWDMFLISGLWLWQLIDAPVSSVRINKERNSKFELTPAFNKSGYGASLKFYF